MCVCVLEFLLVLLFFFSFLVNYCIRKVNSAGSPYTIMIHLALSLSAVILVIIVRCGKYFILE